MQFRRLLLKKFPAYKFIENCIYVKLELFLDFQYVVICFIFNFICLYVVEFKVTTEFNAEENGMKISKKSAIHSTI